MPFLHEATPPTKHLCNKPHLDFYARAGSIWQCDHCYKIWVTGSFGIWNKYRWVNYWNVPKHARPLVKDAIKKRRQHKR